MWIPRSQPMRVPILQFLSSFPPEREVYVEEIVEHLRKHFNLADQATSHPQFRRYAGGALSGLKQDGRPMTMGLIERTCKNHYRITERGREWLGGRNHLNVSVDEAISQAKNLSQWLHEKVNSKRFSISGQQDWGVALLQHSWDIADGIVILLERDLPGPAWTLVRSLSEGFVRGVWLLHCASDEQIKHFQTGKCPLLPELLRAMDNHARAKLHADWIRSSKAIKDVLNDFTHGGFEHVRRRIDKNVVEPRYPAGELESLVGFGIGAYIHVGCELFSLMDDTESIRQLWEKVQTVRGTFLVPAAKKFLEST